MDKLCHENSGSIYVAKVRVALMFTRARHFDALSAASPAVQPCQRGGVRTELGKTRIVTIVHGHSMTSAAKFSSHQTNESPTHQRASHIDTCVSCG